MRKLQSYLACFAVWSSFQNSIRLISIFSWFTLISTHTHTLTPSHTHTLSLTRSVTPYPLSQGETELHTVSTVPWMMMSPTGKRMPPRMATSAPTTAPAISPHLLLQQPMAVCVSLLPLRLPVSWLPVLLSLCVACAAAWLRLCSRQREDSGTGRAIPLERLMEPLRPGKGAHTPLAEAQENPSFTLSNGSVGSRVTLGIRPGDNNRIRLCRKIQKGRVACRLCW